MDSIETVEAGRLAITRVKHDVVKTGGRGGAGKGSESGAASKAEGTGFVDMSDV